MDDFMFEQHHARLNLSKETYVALNPYDFISKRPVDIYQPDYKQY